MWRLSRLRTCEVAAVVAASVALFVGGQFAGGQVRKPTPSKSGDSKAQQTAERLEAFGCPRGLDLVANPRIRLDARWRPRKIMDRDFWHVMQSRLALDPVLKDLPLTRDSGRFLSGDTFWYPLAQELERIPAGMRTPVFGQGVGQEFNRGAFFDAECCKTGIPLAKVKALAASGKPADSVYDMRPLDEKLAELKAFYGDRFLGVSFGEWGNGWFQVSNWVRQDRYRKDGEWGQKRYLGGDVRDLKEPRFPYPKTRREACLTVLGEFARVAKLFHGDFSFMNCSQLWDHYGLELGGRRTEIEYECCAHLREIQIAFGRGAARQYARPWGVSVGTFLGHTSLSYRETPDTPAGGSTGGRRPLIPALASGTINKSGGNFRSSGSTGGRSISTMQRECYLSYLSGANFYRGCAPAYVVKSAQGKSLRVSPYGQMHCEFYEFTRKHPDRGIPYTPVGLALDFHESPWTCWVWSGHWCSRDLPFETCDLMINEVMKTLWPYLGRGGVDRNGACLVNSPFGNLVDVLKPNPPSGVVSLDVLRAYPVLMLLGRFEMTEPLAARLMEYVRDGGTLIINERQLGGEFPAEFLGVVLSDETDRGRTVRVVNDGTVLRSPPYTYRVAKLTGAEAVYSSDTGKALMTKHRCGKGNVLLTTPPWLLGETDKPLPIVFDFLKEVVAQLLPFRVQGDIEYTLNKTEHGWVVGLINNKGVYKEPATPPVVTPEAVAHVSLICPTRPHAALEWTQDKPIEVTRNGAGWKVDVEVPPGGLRVVELKM